MLNFLTTTMLKKGIVEVKSFVIVNFGAPIISAGLITEASEYRR